MNVGIIGLGLIGGSLARAYSKVGHTVLAQEKDSSMLNFAQLAGAVSSTLDKSNIASCQLIFLAVYPQSCVDWLETYGPYISKDATVIDCCGTKTDVCAGCFPIAQQYGFTFVGGHPMAGSHNSGFKYSRSNLFQGAPMVLVPPRYDDITLFAQLKELLEPCHFGSYSVTTAHDHDKMIAFTSQMPHILSNAYIKSPTALMHKGFSAGSYKDLTRVAWLNSNMWAELILNNKENILHELDYFINSLQAYRDAVSHNDIQSLKDLLEEGKLRKEQVDG